MLQWTWGCIYLFKLLFLFSANKDPEVELLDQMVVLFLIFWGTSILFSIVAAPNFNSHQQCTKVPFYLHPLQRLLFLVFLIIDVLTSVSWYLIVVLIFTSLKINDVEHLYMHLLAIFVSSLEKCLFRSSAHFNIRFLKKDYWIVWVLYFGH